MALCNPFLFHSSSEEEQLLEMVLSLPHSELPQAAHTPPSISGRAPGAFQHLLKALGSESLPGVLLFPSGTKD